MNFQGFNVHGKYKKTSSAESSFSSGCPCEHAHLHTGAKIHMYVKKPASPNEFRLLENTKHLYQLLHLQGAVTEILLNIPGNGHSLKAARAAGEFEQSSQGCTG